MKINCISPNNKNFLKTLGKQSWIQTTPNLFSGKNILLSYGASGKSFKLPRFISKEMQEARIMNKFAIRELKSENVKMVCPDADPADLLRLIDTSAEASLSRVRWVNPKDGRVYYLLKSGKNSDGLNNARILDERVHLIKESPLPKKNIVVCELDSPDAGLDEYNGLSHADLVSLFIKKHNPFADIKLCYLTGSDSDNENLAKMIDINTSAISCAFGSSFSFYSGNFLKNWYNKFFNKRLKLDPKFVEESLLSMQKNSIIDFEKIPKNIRIFVASGNNGKNAYNKYLRFKNVEGVGSLDLHGKIADYSASRNSYFTQHYEQGDFPTMQVPEGFMLTGSHSIDIPFLSDKFKELTPLKGTSFSVSIRAAKVVLNQMMEGIL